jgi:hypothetical protein
MLTQVRDVAADGRALLSGIKSTIEQQIIVSMASNADPVSFAHRVGCRITGVSHAAFSVAFPSASEDGVLELCVSGERQLSSAAGKDEDNEDGPVTVFLDGKVQVKLEGGEVTMSGLIAMHYHEPPTSTSGQPQDDATLRMD